MAYDGLNALNALNALPKDLQMLIGGMVHYECMKNVHTEFWRLYKVGISTIIVRNTRLGTRRRRKVFAFVSIDSKFGIDCPKTKFYEISKNVVNIPSMKGWERNPFNYRNINLHFFDDEQCENWNPKMFCIRNGDNNVSILPRRYFYSKPMHPRKYHDFRKIVKQFINTIPSSKSLRGGDL